jgi:hypothetical protein
MVSIIGAKKKEKPEETKCPIKRPAKNKSGMLGLS